MSRIILIFTIVIPCLCSCISTKTGEEPLFIWLTDSSKYFLLSAEHIETPIDNIQFVTVSYGTRNFQAIALVNADESGIEMTVMNEMGSNMAELIWRNGVTSFSSSIFPRTVKPEYIIADFQLCFYNFLALDNALQTIGLILKETGSGRQIIYQDVVIIEIKKSINMVIFTNHLRGYSYTLEGDFS